MTAQILPTKLYIPPPRPHLVARPRLLNALGQGLDRTLTLISAPAGYGKSTILSEWVHQAGAPAAWLSLDGDDNHPARFWRHFIAALRCIPFLDESQVGESFLSLWQASHAPGYESLFTGLIAEIALVQTPFVLVLDDLHAVTERQVLDGLWYLLEHLPVGKIGLHMVLSTRNDPPWPLARWRVRSQIAELRAKDLRFNQEETAQFLHDVMQLPLSQEDIAELDNRTEGWAAGLQMAALSMKDREDISGFLHDFSGNHRFVLDYLMEEVLSQQDPRILDFLLKTSILGRMSGPLCAAVTGVRDSPEILWQLEKANMFVVSLDDQRNWYRYHHLFADLLQKQLLVRYPEIMPELHRRASQWFSQVGSSVESVMHAFNANDWDFTAGQVETFIFDLIQNGEMTLASQWIAALPDEAIRSSPILTVAQAWTSARFGTIELAEGLLTQAEDALSAESPDAEAVSQSTRDFVSRQIEVLQVVIARARGESTDRQRALVLRALQGGAASHDSASRAELLLRLGFCYLDLGNDSQADRIFSQAYGLGRASDNQYAAQSASYARMVIARRHGDLQAAARLCQETLDAMRGHGARQRSLEGIAQTMLGTIQYEWDDLQPAEENLTQGLSSVAKVGSIELIVKGHFALACLRIAQGQVDHFPDLVQMAEKGNPGLGFYAAALQARLHLMRDWKTAAPKLDLYAAQWAGGQLLNLRRQSTYDWEIYEKLVYARILCRQLLLQKDVHIKVSLEQTLHFLEEHCQMLVRLSWSGVLVEVYAVMATILQTLGQRPKALAVLGQALTMAQPLGFVRLFVDEGKLMHEMIQSPSIETAYPNYARKLSLAFERLAGYRPPRIDLIEPLSERELKVLSMLNTQLTVPEIAAEIHLSPATVRTYVQRIYRKLDVHGRIEALQRAEEIGLL